MTDTNETTVQPDEPIIGENGSGEPGLPSYSPEDARAAIQKYLDDLEANNKPVTKTYYPYKDVVVGKTTLQAYTGTPVTVAVDAEQPSNTLQWAPTVTSSAGVLVYVDNAAWHVGQDITKLTLQQVQDLCLLKTQRTFEDASFALTSSYSAQEQKSWQQQVVEASGLIAGTIKNPTLLTALATARKLDVKALAQKVVDKNNAYIANYSAILATFQATRDAIQAATSIDDLPALTVDDVSLLNYIASAGG